MCLIATPEGRAAGVQRRGESSCAAIPCWSARSAFSRPDAGAAAVEGRKRPALRCFGPWRASHVARRAASSRTSSFEEKRSSLMVLAKAKASFVAVPMIPLVHERLVNLLKKRQAAMISAPHVELRHG